MTAAEGTAGEDGKKAMLVGGREKGQNHKSLLSSSALYQYILETSVYPREVECMKELREITAKHPLNGIASSADVVQFIAMLLKLINAKNTIEVGVFTGYSLLATALALPDDGKIVAIDMDHETFKLGLPVIEKAGVAHKVDFREGLALPLLQDMVKDEKYRGSFDFVFVDADKCNYANYHNAAVELVRVGGVIAYDNTLWNGSVVAPPEVVMPEYILKSRPYIMAFNDYLAGDNRVEICHLSIGDGLTLCRRRQ